MKETKDLVQSVKENRTCDDFLFFVIAIKDFLGQLNVPVRKFIPDEVVEDVSSHTKFKLVKVGSSFSDGFIEVVENPTVCDISSFLVDNFFNISSCLLESQDFIIHEDVARDVPDLVNEVP